MQTQQWALDAGALNILLSIFSSLLGDLGLGSLASSVALPASAAAAAAAAPGSLSARPGGPAPSSSVTAECSAFLHGLSCHVREHLPSRMLFVETGGFEVLIRAISPLAPAAVWRRALFLMRSLVASDPVLAERVSVVAQLIPSVVAVLTAADADDIDARESALHALLALTGGGDACALPASSPAYASNLGACASASLGLAAWLSTRLALIRALPAGSDDSESAAVELALAEQLLGRVATRAP
jgi:hypothetical protein